MSATDATKDDVREFWDAASCGEVYAEGAEGAEAFARQAARRYELEPYIAEFAGFADGAGKDVLEIGVGMGADHLQWAAAGPRSLVGVDLTPRAVEWTTQRLAAAGYEPDVRVADAEALPFDDDSFDLVYSWGVLHHSPDTPQCFREVARVLRPGGEARIMIYHSRSVVGALLWARYALAAGKPSRSMADIYANHLESPGTKAYSRAQADELCAPFRLARIDVQLSFGDLLLGEAGQQHQGALLDAARRVWPRSLLRRYGANLGLYLLIRAIA